MLENRPGALSVSKRSSTPTRNSGGPIQPWIEPNCTPSICRGIGAELARRIDFGLDAAAGILLDQRRETLQIFMLRIVDGGRRQLHHDGLRLRLRRRGRQQGDHHPAGDSHAQRREQHVSCLPHFSILPCVTTGRSLNLPEFEAFCSGCRQRCAKASHRVETLTSPHSRGLGRHNIADRTIIFSASRRAYRCSPAARPPLLPTRPTARRRSCSCSSRSPARHRISRTACAVRRSRSRAGPRRD